MRPVCSLCGSKHFQREPHIFKDEVKPEVLRVPVVNVAVNAVVNTPKKEGDGKRPVVSQAEATSHKSKDRHKKVRNDYFREYMKAYRAIKAGRALPLKVPSS